MENDDRPLTRPDAVLCSLGELAGGRVRVVLDDLRRADQTTHWRHQAFVTSKDYPAELLADPSALSEEELADLGLSVLTRLLATNGYLRDVHEGPDSDMPLTDLQQRSIASLTDEDIAWIDRQLLSHCDGQFRKIAYIVGTAMSLDPERRPGIPDVFYAQRVRVLVERGLLEEQGDITRMRYCEVRRVV